MFRPLSGFKARVGEFSLVVVSEFDEWRVVAHSPDVILQGQRQFKDTKAKEHACLLIKNYYEEIRKEAAPDLIQLDWQPTGPADWLVWKT
jgi:hypothetical protein